MNWVEEKGVAFGYFLRTAKKIINDLIASKRRRSEQSQLRRKERHLAISREHGNKYK